MYRTSDLKFRPFRWMMVAAAGLAAATPLQAQEVYPSRAIQLIVPYPPGGSTDVNGRILATTLTRVMRQAVVVDNRAGGGGTTGAVAVAHAKADGYTVMFTAGVSFVLNKLLEPALPYEPIKDYEPVAMVAGLEQFLVTGPKMGVKDVGGFVAKVRAEPGRYNYASAGVGTMQQFAGAVFASAAGLSMQHVPYKGAAPGLTSTMVGETSLMMSPSTSFIKLAQNGSVVPLVVLSNRRSAVLPAVPTVTEAGFPEVMQTSAWSSWAAVFAPAGTPREVVQKLNTAINAALRDPDLIRRFAEIAVQNLAGSTPESTRQFVTKDYGNWQAILKRVNVEMPR